MTACTKMGELTATAVLILLIPWVSAQIDTDDSPQLSFVAQLSVRQLRFVAQLSVSGCALFVYDTEANDGPHLAIEPIMCVTERLNGTKHQYNPITQQRYVSIPVMLRDDAMLAEVQRQLGHLSPKSVKFATVSDISVSTEESSMFKVLEFIWSPDESVGLVRLGCKSSIKNCSVCQLSARLRGSNFEALHQVILAATLISNGVAMQLKYRVSVANETFLDQDFHIQRFNSLPSCRQLRFARSIIHGNCTARVHQQLDMKGHFLIEPLLCHNITSLTDESIMYDYSRDKFYLKLDVVLQDDMTLDAVRTQLSDLSPRSVAFMRLWRAESHVASALSRRFEVGPLMLSGDGRRAQLRVYCGSQYYDCVALRHAVVAKPIDLWQYIKYNQTSSFSDRCILKPEILKHPWSVQHGGSAPAVPECDLQDRTRRHANSQFFKFRVGFALRPEGRQFIVIQQRLTGNVSFQRTWVEYENGFGDETDFWIGLTLINSLTGSTPKLLRVEAVTWSDVLYISEYSGFSVGDASTAYTMTFDSYLRASSNTTHDSLSDSRNHRFSTFDKYDSSLGCASDSLADANRGGWWYHGCSHCNPNGIYERSAVDNGKRSNMNYYGADGWKALKSIRLMLLI